MKLHLPLVLLSALLGAFVVQAVEIPDDYEQIDLWAPSYLDDYTANTADDKYAFILWTDVNFTPTTNPTWTSSAPLVKGGNLLFTTADGYAPRALSFSNGTYSVFEHPTSLTFDTLSNLSINGQSGLAAVNLDTSGKLYIRNVNDDVESTEDVVLSHNESAIFASGSSSVIGISDNGVVSIRDNYSSAGDRAIYSGGSLNINNNEEVNICSNTVYNFGYNSRGGAIYSTGSVSINNNEGVSIRGNSINSYESRGGAIYSTGSVSINNNEGGVSISGNSATGGSFSRGGAIYSTGRVSINNNEGGVIISANSAKYGPAYSRGGAIYSTGSLSIVGNDSVIFEKNYEKTNSGSYLLRSIYMRPSSTYSLFDLAAKTGGHITFYDSVYMDIGSGATIMFNADYQDVNGVKQKATGDIIFSGEFTKAHLEDITGKSASSSEINDSQTSYIGGDRITLYGGSLQVVDGAKLNGRGLSVAAGSGAKLLLRDGSMNHGNGQFYFNNGTSLELLGLNTITASEIILDSGSALTVTVGEDNLNTAALTLGATDLATAKLTVNLKREDGLTSGMYKIISQSSASDFTTQSAWTAENVTVNGSGHANRATFGDLVWKDGTLYYNVGRTIWGNASGDRLWNTSSDNWTMNDRSYTYLDGMDVTFTDLGAGDVKLVGDIAPSDIIVNNSKGNDYTFTAADGGGRLVGATGITKNGTGALTLTTANTHTGATVLNAGTLNVHNSTALGATATAATATVTTATGSTLTIDNKSHVVLSAENDMKGAVSVAEGSTLEMRNKGYAAESSRVDGTLHFKSDAAATSNAGTLSGTGTVMVENSGVSFTMIKSFTGNMAVEGAAARLNIGSGNYSASGQISINGAGATLNMSSSDITMRSGGKLTLRSDGAAAVLQGNNITIAAGATLSVENLTAPSIGFNEETPITLSTGTGGFDPTIAFNTTQSGIIESKLLTLQQGSIYEALGGNISMNGGELTLAITPVATEKIELILTLAAGYTADSQVVLFTDVNTVNFIFDGVTAKDTSGLVYEFSADDYFEGDWINEATKLKYDATNKVVYVENVNYVIPEPTTTTLSLLALAAMAARRRRK